MKRLILKNLKLFLVLLTTGLVFFSCSTEEDFITSTKATDLSEIAKVRLYDFNEQKEVTVTTEYLKQKWENQLKKEGYNVKLKEFEIIETFDENNNKLFFLKTSSINNTLETGAFILKDDAGNYKLGTKQCTCEGCPNGCHIEVSGTTCTCSKCPSTNSNKSCEKKETVIIDA